ncbi:AraC family transcriptional regulator [Flavobacterium sp. J27]|uniref:helix-turn-helix domain-containing protein n=1 Tax=Flavobacterium sp. J27 TaxID=2060419 RepID=UPI001031D493|nr:helix-turn-helix domain-containing protein [Flavobacterium sp. J27]
MTKAIYALFAGTSLLLFFLVFTNTQKINIKANKWFSGFIACIFFIAFDNFLYEINILRDHFFLNLIDNFCCFSIAPIFYFSVVYFTNPEKKWNTNDYFHFITPLLVVILFIAFYFIDGFEETFKKGNFINNVIELVLISFLLTQLLLYPIFSYLKLLKHKKNTFLFSSNIEKIDLKWLQYVCLSIVIMIFCWSLEIILNISEPIQNVVSPIVDTIYLLGMFFITYNWSKQKEIYPFFSIQSIHEVIEQNEDSNQKKKKLIDDEELLDYKHNLLQLMNQKKLFLDNELNLEKLAQELDTSTHILSYIINNGFNENFYQFVNRYRIEEAKELIQKSDHLSLLGIGFEVGFNSKTTFNTTFKKITGKTPSEYKKMSSDL